MLEAGGCDLSKGFLLWPVCQTVWRAVEGLASPRLLDEKASNMCFLWHSNQPLPLPPSPTAPLPISSRGGLPAETGRLIPPCSALLLYPSDKAVCISFSSRLLFKKKELSPFSLSPVWCLRLSSSLPASWQDSWVTAIWEVNSIPPRVVQRRS